MASFSEIAATISANLKAGQAALQGTPVALPDYADGITQVLQPSALVLHDADVESGEQQVSINGKASLLGLVDAQLSLGFRLLQGQCFFFVDIPVEQAPILHALTGLFALFRMISSPSVPPEKQGPSTATAVHPSGSAIDSIQHNTSEETEFDLDGEAP